VGHLPWPVVGLARENEIMDVKNSKSGVTNYFLDGLNGAKEKKLCVHMCVGEVMVREKICGS
jgi:hypothetical protein